MSVHDWSDIEHGGQGATVGWETPVPLSGPAPAESLPVSVFPAWLRDQVEAVARFTQTDVTMAAGFALSILATCVGGRVVVEPVPGWREPTNLLTATIAEPGERKSPVYSALVAPLRAAEHTISAAAGPLITEQAALREIAERSAERAKAEAAKAAPEHRDALMTEAVSAALDAAAVTVAEPPRLITDDATPEALASLMAANDGRIAILSDEGGIFDILAGRFSAAVYLDPYLKGHAGTPMRVDRRGRESEHIPSPALTVGVMAQPSKLRKFGSNADLNGNGMVARFLVTIPASLVGWRQSASYPIPAEVAEVYHQTIHDLAVAHAHTAEPVVLTLTEEAQTVRIAQADAIEVQLRPGGSLRDMREWATKLAGATVRLAGLLHVAHHPVTAAQRPISGDTMRAAVTLARSFVEHYKTALQVIATDPDNGHVGHVLDVLIDKGMTTFTRREVQRRVQRRLPKAAAVIEVLDTLTSLGWIRANADGSGYQLHPDATGLRESGDTVTIALEHAFSAGQEGFEAVTAPDDTPVTAVTVGAP